MYSINLPQIDMIVDKYPELFQSHYQHFFIYSLERSFTDAKKMDILIKISTESNVGQILDELSGYIFSKKEAVAKAAVRAVGKIWAKHSTLRKNILINLMKNKTLTNKSLNEEIVISICDFVETLKTPEQIEKQAPMIAMMTTFFVELENKNAQLILLKQFFKFIVVYANLDHIALHDDRNA